MSAAEDVVTEAPAVEAVPKRAMTLGYGTSLVVLAMLLIVPLLVKNFIIFQLTMLLIYGLAVLALNILTGGSGQFSLGQQLDANRQLSDSAGLIAVMMELLVYRTLRRRRVPIMNIITATVGMSILCINAARLIWGSEPLRFPELFAATAYEFAGVRISPQLFWIMVMAVAIMGALQLFLKFTRTGIAMQAVAQDPEAAQLMGANLTRMMAYTFAISGMMAGAAGIMLGSMFFAFFEMGFITGLKGFVAATLGGLGSIAGAMLGGILFGLIETFSTVFLSSAYKDAIGMILLIAILLVLPSGLVGLWQRRR